MLPHNISIEEMMTSQAKQVEWLKFLTDNGGALMGQKYVYNLILENYFSINLLNILGLSNYYGLKHSTKNQLSNSHHLFNNHHQIFHCK